jgi:hypothetical protein
MIRTISGAGADCGEGAAMICPPQDDKAVNRSVPSPLATRMFAWTGH